MDTRCRRSEQDADVDARAIPKSPWDMKKLQVQQRYNPFHTW